MNVNIVIKKEEDMEKGGLHGNSTISVCAIRKTICL